MISNTHTNTYTYTHIKHTCSLSDCIYLPYDIAISLVLYDVAYDRYHPYDINMAMLAYTLMHFTYRLHIPFI